MKIVYYFDDYYYSRSGSMMGVLYTEDGERYDWGFLRMDVEAGIDVLVRKATPEMIRWADERLEEYMINERTTF